MSKKITTQDTLDIVYDCLLAMDAVIDNHPEDYNGTISALIMYARDQIEDAKRDKRK